MKVSALIAPGNGPLSLTGPAADTCLDLALDLATRPPGTAHALRAGLIDYLRAPAARINGRRNPGQFTVAATN